MKIDKCVFISLWAIAFVVCFTLPHSAVAEDCTSFNKSCSDCTGHSQCYWCSSTEACTNYPGWTKIVPRDCPSREWFYGQCRVSGQVLIILVPSLVAVFLLFLGCCIYCCCCRQCNKCRKKRMDKEDAKLKRKREEMTALHAQKRSEREVKRDEIRKKYGLRPGSSGYQRIEDNPWIHRSGIFGELLSHIVIIIRRLKNALFWEET